MGSWAFAWTKIHILSQFWPNDIKIHRVDPGICPNNWRKFINSFGHVSPRFANSWRVVLLREAALLRGSRLYKPCNNETLRGSAGDSPKFKPNRGRIRDFQAKFRDHEISWNFVISIIFAHVAGPWPGPNFLIRIFGKLSFCMDQTTYLNSKLTQP